MVDKRVAIIIVNYCCEEFTRQCLQSLRSLAYPKFEIIVVDNASPDGSGTRLMSATESGETTVICSSVNRGFAAGCNAGIREALKRRVDYVWLLNPDTEVHPAALTALIDQCVTSDDIAAVGSKILYPPNGAEAGTRIWGAGGRIDLARRIIEMYGAGKIDDGSFDTVRDCDYLPGCSLLVPRRVIERIGLMPEEYFMYFEETDWCVRMRRAKGRLLYVPTSLVYHKFDDSKLAGPFMVYYYNRNSNIFWSRQLGTLQRLRLFLRVALKDLPRSRQAEQACADQEQRKIFRAHVQANLDFLRHRYGQQTLS